MLFVVYKRLLLLHPFNSLFF